MAKATTTITFANGDQVTSAKLNQIVSGLSFTTGDLTGTTLLVVAGKLKVGTITSSEMGAASVTNSAIGFQAVQTTNIYPSAVTGEKIASSSINSSHVVAGSLTFALQASTALATQAVMEAETAGYFVTPNRVKYALGTAKAYGEFNIASSSRAIKSNSLNVTSLTRIDSTHTTVTLDDNMNSVNYTVLVSGISDGTENVDAYVYDKAAGSFKIRHSVEASSRAINFVVFGTYA